MVLLKDWFAVSLTDVMGSFLFRYIPVNFMKNKQELSGRKTRVRNDMFNPGVGLDRMRSTWVEALWYFAKMLFFLTAFPWPSKVKAQILRIFGATVGVGVVIKPRVNIHMPWKLHVGDYTWIGEEVNIINFEQVWVGRHVCISQRAFLCCGNHDFREPSMPYRNAPIRLSDGCWIGAQVFVSPGVTGGVDSVATVGSIVVRDLPDGMVCAGNPCVPIKPRWRS